VLGLFEERITAMKESLALEAADTSKMMDATTSTARGLHSTRKNGGSGMTSGGGGGGGVWGGSIPIDPLEVFGIDTDV